MKAKALRVGARGGVLALVLAVSLMVAARLSGQSGVRKPPKGYVALFNGMDFTGWWSPVGAIEPVWEVKDGILFGKRKGEGARALYTRKTYENFILELDYKIAKHGNSGVFIHAPWIGRQSRTGFELQIIDDYGKKPFKGSTGAVYDVVPPRENASKPAGQWNHYKIEMNYPKLRVWLNGKKIQDLNFADHPVLRFRFRDGYIGLQRHGSDVWFRNIWIKELPGKVKWDTLAQDPGLSRWTTRGKAQWQVKEDVLEASGSEGWLVSKDNFDAYELQGYLKKVDHSPAEIWYRWASAEDPGYVAELYGFRPFRKLCDFYNAYHPFPWWIVPPFKHSWLPVQVISYGPFAEVRINGVIVKRVLNHNRVRPGKIALHFYGGQDTLRLKGLRIRKLGPEERNIP